MTQSETIFCGNGKPIVTKQGDVIGYKMGIEYAKLAEYVNEKGWINLDLLQKREVGKYGDTHYIKVDTWKKDGNVGMAQTVEPPAQKVSVSNFDDIADSDLPF